MKNLFLLTAVCLGISGATANLAAQTAEARMYCLSVRLGKASGPAWWYTLEFTGINNGINGELYPVFGAPRTHFTSLRLNDEIFDETYPGAMLLDVPGGDANGDGFPDIFDVSLPFSGSSSGSYSLPGYNGTVAATWSRSAGSYAGTCQIVLQHFGTFTSTFNVLEYKGLLNYTPGASSVSGTIDLALTGVPGWFLEGPVGFTKSVTDAYNELTLQAGQWTNASQQSFPFLTDVFSRDPDWPTNYYGYVEFDDWDLSTFEPDYYLWVLSIDDLNDSDGDGIPDFSDDPGTVPPAAPLLSLARTASELHLTISGTIGQTCEIEQTSSLSSPAWTTASTVTLTSNPHVVTLPMPSFETMFWRVKVP